jgi:hypothetical protein
MGKMIKKAALLFSIFMSGSLEILSYLALAETSIHCSLAKGK